MSQNWRKSGGMTRNQNYNNVRNTNHYSNLLDTIHFGTQNTTTLQQSKLNIGFIRSNSNRFIGNHLFIPESFGFSTNIFNGNSCDGILPITDGSFITQLVNDTSYLTWTDSNGVVHSNDTTTSSFAISQDSAGDNDSQSLITIAGGKYQTSIIGLQGWDTMNCRNHSLNLSLNPIGGNVGIRTVDPTATLDVSGTLAVSGIATCATSSNSSGTDVATLDWVIDHTSSSSSDDGWNTDISNGSIALNSQYNTVDISGVLKVDGATTLNNSLNINTNYGESQNSSLTVTDSISGQNLYIIPNISVGYLNPISPDGSTTAIVAKGSAINNTILELSCWADIYSGILISNHEVFLGYGGDEDQGYPTYSISLDNSGTKIDSNLNVSANSTLNTLTVSGATTMNSTLDVSGIATCATSSNSSGNDVATLDWVVSHTSSGGGGWNTNDTNNSITSNSQYNTVDINGTLTVSGKCSANQFNTTSDVRLKENITDLDNSLDKICNIRGVNYNWKKDENKTQTTGVIAQEVLQQIPEAICNNVNNDILSVDYNAIIAHLIESVKELKREINELKSNK